MIDKDVLLRIARGDEAAFKMLYELLYDPVYSMAYSFLKSSAHAEDVVQDIFIKVWSKRMLLPSIINAEAYLMRLARNHIINEFRDKITVIEFTDQIEKYFSELESTSQSETTMKETEKLINMAVEKLPPQQKTVFKLSRCEELNRKEIAGQMGLTELTVRNHLNRALAFIRHYIRVNL